MLLAGPPGLGKTSLAGIIAAEMSSALRMMSGPAIDRKADMAAIMTALEPNDVLFIDEIHRLNRAIEELLYPAMEDGCIDIVIGQGPGAHSIRLDLAPFTLVGATTRTGLLTTPLRDRFGITHRLDHYGPDEIEQIVRRSAGILGVEIDEGGAREIARRSRGTPRVANRILRRVRDFAQVRHEGEITHEIASEALELFEVDDARAGADRPRDPARTWPRRSRAARWGCPRWRSRSARSRTRSRTSTSPTCCRGACCSARRAAAWSRTPPTSTWGCRRRHRDPRLF